MTPHLVKWHDEYSERGLRIVEVDNGQVDELVDVEEHLAEEGIPFPVLHDTDGEVCGRFGILGYPTAYLIGRDGRVIWEGHPGDVPNHERMIEAALGM